MLKSNLYLYTRTLRLKLVTLIQMKNINVKLKFCF